MTHHPDELCMVDHGGRPCTCAGFNGNPPGLNVHPFHEPNKHWCTGCDKCRPPQPTSHNCCEGVGYKNLGIGDECKCSCHKMQPHEGTGEKLFSQPPIESRAVINPSLIPPQDWRERLKEDIKKRVFQLSIMKNGDVSLGEIAIKQEELLNAIRSLLAKEIEAAVEDSKQRTIADIRSRLAMVHPKKDADPNEVAEHCYQVVARMSSPTNHKDAPV